jgi:hypothetical protein
MFGGTIWTLLSPQSTYPVNRKMFAVACSLLVMSTAVRVSWISNGHWQILIIWYAAHYSPYHKGHVWFDIVPRHLARRPCWVFFGCIAVDVQRQEPLVYYTVVDRGRSYRGCFSLCVETNFHSRLLIALQLYRVYMVWQSKFILIFPLCLWCATGGTCATCFRGD